MLFRRPNLNASIRLLLQDVVEHVDEFAHIQPDRILVVAGEARRASRGTVKPLTFAGAKSRDALGHRKPIVRVEGRRMLYCITLRPLFFRASTATTRIGTLLHELFHISPKFDGTLDARHRHERMGKDFAQRLRPIVRRYLKRCPEELSAAFDHDGEVRVLQWLERPGVSYVPGGKGRGVYTEKHLFTASVRMITRRLLPPKRLSLKKIGEL